MGADLFGDFPDHLPQRHKSVLRFILPSLCFRANGVKDLQLSVEPGAFLFIARYAVDRKYVYTYADRRAVDRLMDNSGIRIPYSGVRQVPLFIVLKSADMELTLAGLSKTFYELLIVIPRHHNIPVVVPGDKAVMPHSTQTGPAGKEILDSVFLAI